MKRILDSRLVSWLADQQFIPHLDGPRSSLAVHVRLWLVQRLTALARSPGTTLALISLLAALSVPCQALASAVLESPSRGAFVTIAFVLAGLPIAVLQGARLVLDSASPREYAEFMLSSRTDAEVLTTISDHIWHECARFAAIARDRRIAVAFTQQIKNLQGIAHDADDWRTQMRRYDATFDGVLATKVVERLERLRIKQGVRLERIFEMKMATTRRLGVPGRRLCDHVLQYSPAMHRDRVRKYVDNWRELALFFAQSSPRIHSDVERVRSLILQNERIWDDAQRQMDHQRELVEHGGLHGFVRDFVSMRSQSATIVSYARALRQLGESRRRDLEQPGSREAARKIRDRCNYDLKFLFRKQLGHSGVDPNSALLGLCQAIKHALDNDEITEVAERARYKREVVLRQIEILERLRDTRPGDVPQVFGDDRNTSVQRLQAIVALEGYARTFVDNRRADVVAECREFLKEVLQSRTREGAVYIATHGYSKAIRAALKDGLRQLLVQCGDEDWYREPYVFILQFEGDEESDAQLLEYELRYEQKGIPEKGYAGIAVGSDVVLAHTAGRSGTVVLLTGAQVFDDEGRVVCPKTTAEAVRRSQAYLAHADVECRVAVLAEEYKRGKIAGRRSRLANEHFDRMAVSSLGETVTILTGRGSARGTGGELNLSLLVEEVSGAFELSRSVSVSPGARRIMVARAEPHAAEVRRSLDAGRITLADLREGVSTILRNAMAVMEEGGVESGTVTEEVVAEAMRRECPYLFWC